MREHSTALRVLAARDIDQALPMSEAVNIVRTAFEQLASGKVQMPVRSHIDIPEHAGSALFMPSYAPCFGNIGIKTVNVFGRNPQRGLPRIQALVCLFDSQTGSPRALLDGTALTALRTGAASGVATDVLARNDAATVAIFGAGIQGRTQLQAVRKVRNLRSATVYDPQVDAARRFARDMSECLTMEVTVAETPQRAVRGADIVCTATVSSTPVFEDADIMPGTHINAIGSYQPHVQEIPARTIARADVVVDHRQSVLAETGDLLIPLHKGLISKEHIRAELGDILIGKAGGRDSDKSVTLFKSVGVAIQDLAVASRALEIAEAGDLGISVEL